MHKLRSVHKSPYPPEMAYSANDCSLIEMEGLRPYSLVAPNSLSTSTDTSPSSTLHNLINSLVHPS